MDKVRKAVEAIFDEIATPSPPYERGYRAAVIACGHVFLGLIAFEIGARLIGFVPIWWSLAVIAFYYLSKEMRDVGKGGSRIDGLTDTAFVAFGAFNISYVVAGICVCVEAVCKEMRYQNDRKLH